MNGVTTVTGPLTLTVPTQLTGDGDRVGVAADGGADDVDVRDDLRRAGGLTVGAGQTLTVATGNQHVLAGGGTLRNHGTVLWTGGTIFIQDNSAVVNDSTGAVGGARGSRRSPRRAAGRRPSPMPARCARPRGTGDLTIAQLRGGDQHRHDRVADRDAVRSSRRSPRAGISSSARARPSSSIR